ncbi:hypothetical protein [Larsenimonas salina]|uniref:hypothetical protein n=1 Tax=Larsenimonas salina TaxID=1295565 RepID=UPI002072AD4B|nr:hypothetical protein [Larsenimonas salina]MCM5704844.1 hypothetical protein [Larsenimonas salina]
MSIDIKFNNLFVGSESSKLCFYEEFSPQANIISGRNTSGKSSLLQSILFTFGINDVRENLSEILDYKPIFRVDFTKTTEGNQERYTIVREENSIYIREPNGKVVPFYGINADQSSEHIKLKEYVRNLTGFSLHLEQHGELKSAPLESMFLPYYISQSVGWVYLRESFSNLQYYKNFQSDYLDYYLGIINNFDRKLHKQLTRRKEELRSNIKNLERYSQKAELQFSNLIDEQFGIDAENYIKEYVDFSKSLEDERNSYIRFCNNLSLLQNHHKIIKRTKKHVHKQSYNDIDRCPACTQVLSYSLEGLYSYYQKYNDTIELESKIKENITLEKSKINSSAKRINSLKETISSKYEEVLNVEFDGVTFEQWIKNKASVELYSKIKLDIKNFEEEVLKTNEHLRSMSTEEDVIRKRKEKEKEFKTIFSNYLSKLSLPPLTSFRYLNLYEIRSFPRQGVELHKTVMAYHFALNTIIAKSNFAHRLPFMLDAILKEDIDETNIDVILSFAGNNLPTDTQSFISISEHVKDGVANQTDQGIKPIEKLNIREVKNTYFPENSKIIYIGDGKIERGLISLTLDNYQKIYEDTIAITSI